MFKNCVFKVSVDTKKWLKAAGMRAVKTFAETAVSLITVGTAFYDLDWVHILSVSATAMIVSILLSVAGLKEVEAKE